MTKGGEKWISIAIVFLIKYNWTFVSGHSVRNKTVTCRNIEERADNKTVTCRNIEERADNKTVGPYKHVNIGQHKLL